MSVEPLGRMLEEHFANVIELDAKNRGNVLPRGFAAQFVAGRVKRILRNHRGIAAEISANVQKHLLACTVLCLTTDPADHAMWTHYADRHGGVVLEFSTEELDESPFWLAKPVRYSSEMPGWYTDTNLEDIRSGLRLSPATMVERAVYTKPESYRFEREWRIYSGLGHTVEGAAEFRPFPRQTLVSVTMGIRTRWDQFPEVRAILDSHYPRAKLLQVRLTDRSYKIFIHNTRHDPQDDSDT